MSSGPVTSQRPGLMRRMSLGPPVISVEDALAYWRTSANATVHLTLFEPSAYPGSLSTRRFESSK